MLFSKSSLTHLVLTIFRFLKLFINSILNHLTYIFNTSITSGILDFPRWYQLRRYLIHLSRPISILAALSKALEILMRDQMVCFLETVGALDVFQSGFRSGHSTVTALLNITDNVHGYLDRGLFVVLVLLDFTKAFGSVDHDLFLPQAWTFL
jgi:hypothetical protein